MPCILNPEAQTKALHDPYIPPTGPPRFPALNLIVFPVSPGHHSQGIPQPGHAPSTLRRPFE